jgi:hypothetical protein
MLVNPEDAPTSIDGPEASLGLSTQIRIGHLVPELGPIGLCILFPGSTTWTPLHGPSMVGDAGTMSDAEAGASDADADAGGAVDAALDTGLADAAADHGLVDGGLDADRALDADGASPRDAHHGDASASSAQLAPLTLTRYLHLDAAGTFELAVLPVGAASCSEAYFTQAVTLDSDLLTTIVLVQTRPGPLGTPRSYLGDESVPFGLLTFTDELGTGSELARTRFINTVIPSAAEAGTGALSIAILNTTADLAPLASVVEPDMATSPSQVPPIVDAFGYHDGYAMSGACSDASSIGCLSLRIAPAGGGTALPWTSASEDLGLGPGSVHTAFILSGVGVEFKVLWCSDLSQRTALTDCVTIGQ